MDRLKSVYISGIKKTKALTRVKPLILTHQTNNFYTYIWNNVNLNSERHCLNTKIFFVNRLAINPLILLIFLCVCASGSWAMDVLKMPTPQYRKDTRIEYKNEVLKLALEATETEYGPFIITPDSPPMPRKRAIEALRTGVYINVYIAPIIPSWLEQMITIKIPIRRGILDYRLLIVHKSQLPLFENITSVESLRKFRAGSIFGESMTAVLRKQGFNLVTANNYDGSFSMLENKRYDWLSRGVHEIFDELELRKNSIEHVVIEPTLAIKTQLPTIIYVSPSAPRLAERLRKGLVIIAENGTLKSIFDKYYSDDIKRAELSKRRILTIANPFIPEGFLPKNPNLWFHPKETMPQQPE